LECNPKLTGAFPVLSQLHLKAGVIPLDVFHVLEFMGLPYDMDPVFMNRQYAIPLKGSHLILYNWPTRRGIHGGRLRGGLHEYDPERDSIAFIGEELDFPSNQHGEQFIILEGPPETGCGEPPFSDPLFRICRILFPAPVLDSQGRLSPRVLQVINKIYESVMP
jgi:hypothetical protein